MEALVSEVRRLITFVPEEVRIASPENPWCQENWLECNVVRGPMWFWKKVDEDTIIVYKYYSHTQTDCDSAGNECNIEEMDEESKQPIAVVFRDRIYLLELAE